jgi:hypothetical protein
VRRQIVWHYAAKSGEEKLRRLGPEIGPSCHSSSSSISSIVAAAALVVVVVALVVDVRRQ